jgi:hypothetical protein
VVWIDQHRYVRAQAKKFLDEILDYQSFMAESKSHDYQRFTALSCGHPQKALEPACVDRVLRRTRLQQFDLESRRISSHRYLSKRVL